MYHSPLDVSVIGKASAAGARPSMCWKLSATLAAWGAVRQKLTVLLALTIGPAHVVGTGPVVGLAEFTIVGAAWARAACLTELEGNASVGEVKPAAPRPAAPLRRAGSRRICMGDLLWPGCVLQLAGWESPASRARPCPDPSSSRNPSNGVDRLPASGGRLIEPQPSSAGRPTRPSAASSR